MNPTSLLVTDTNVWIDLDNGTVLADVFQLPYKFVIPDFAISEFQRPQWKDLQHLGLISHALDPEMVLHIYELKQIHHAISLIDLSAFLLAITLPGTLITGDGHLYKLAREYNLTVHGVLWILDELVRNEINHLIRSQKLSNACSFAIPGCRQMKANCVWANGRCKYIRVIILSKRTSLLPDFNTFLAHARR
jgi:hypothetical protein